MTEIAKGKPLAKEFKCFFKKKKRLKYIIKIYFYTKIQYFAIS